MDPISALEALASTCCSTSMLLSSLGTASARASGIAPAAGASAGLDSQPLQMAQYLCGMLMGLMLGNCAQQASSQLGSSGGVPDLSGLTGNLGAGLPVGLSSGVPDLTGGLSGGLAGANGGRKKDGGGRKGGGGEASGASSASGGSGGSGGVSGGADSGGGKAGSGGKDSSGPVAPGAEGMLDHARKMIGLNERSDTKAIQAVTGESGINPASTPWCAAFAMNLLKDHGVLNLDGLSNRNYCPTIKSWAQNKGIWGSRGQYQPKPGDAILFDWNHDGTMDHIGLVEKVQGGKVTTIEGNSSDSVKRNSYTLNSSSIGGYVITGKDSGGKTKK